MTDHLPEWANDEDVPTPDELATRRAAARWGDQVPARFRDARMADLAGEGDEVLRRLRDWSADPAGRNLVVLGPVGVGKTHAAVATCRGQAGAGRHVVFRPVVELLDDLRPGGPEGALAEAMAADVLVLDDLAAERVTDWTAERLYAVVNRRWMEQRPIVATANLEPDELAQVLGERMYSRLVGGAVVVRLAGPDRRRHRG